MGTSQAQAQDSKFTSVFSGAGTDAVSFEAELEYRDCWNVMISVPMYISDRI